MAIKKYYENPKTTDTILFDLYTPQNDGCFQANPLFFDSIKIFFISRSQVQQKDLSISEVNYDPALQRATYVATEEYCAETDSAAKQQLEVVKNELSNRLENNALITEPLGNITFYSEANNVFCAGVGCGMQGPLWIDGDDEYNKNSILRWVSEDTEVPYGHFAFLWTPGIIKEGDYYICYSYTTRISQYQTKTTPNYIHFYIRPNIQNEISIPSHGCPPDKYITLLNAYLPKMYLENYAKQDESVFTLEALNESVAQVFTGLDDQASRLIDILNANDTPEPYLAYLAQLFQLKLRSTDVTRWRGQIITAVPQFKRKGTLQALVQAFDQAGIMLTSYYQYWQITFPQVFTETFKFTSSYEFLLEKYTNDDYQSDYPSIFEVQLARKNTDTFVTQSPTVVSFSLNTDNVTVMTWDSSAVTLFAGDIVKVTYVTEPLTTQQQTLYAYWRDYLPLLDTRPFFVLNAVGDFISRLDLQEAPKNWNTRLILQTDPLFSTFIPTLNPFTDPVVFGFIRTEFPYSENVYNMDEYNGSVRVSNDPKDMGPDFIEPCSGGISAYYGLDLVVQDLSDFRVSEIMGIIADYTPFHSILHTLNVIGSLEEFILPPAETIEWIMQYNISDYFIAGDAQFAFNRQSILYDFTSPLSSTVVEPGVNGRLAFLRDMFATVTTRTTGTLTVYNKELAIKGLVNNINFDNLNLNLSNNILQILGPSSYAGIYTNIIKSTSPFSVNLTDAGATALNSILPINNSEYFTWQLSNEVYSGTFDLNNFYQYSLYDENIKLSNYDIKTVNADGSSDAWTVTLGGNTYKILYINNNTIYLENNISTPLSTSPASGVTYSVTDTQTSSEAYNSSTGVYNLCKIVKVTSASFSLDNFCLGVPSPEVYLSTDSGVNQYKFYSLDPDDPNSFYILDYTIGLTTVTTTCQIYNRLVTDYGNLNFEGMYVVLGTGPDTFYNPDQVVLHSQLIPQNCILQITTAVGPPATTQDYVLNIDFNNTVSKTTATIDVLGYFITVGTSATGSGASYGFELFQFSEIEQPPIVPDISGQTLYYINRAGQDVWSYTVDQASGFMFHMTTPEVQVAVPGKPVDFVKNNENVGFVIQYKNGEQVQGEIK